jgi:hypothetical protein
MTAAASRRRRSAPRLSLLGLSVVIALLALSWTWTRVALTLKHVDPVRQTQPRQNAIVWGDRVFGNQHTLGSWLAVRGHSYSRWAQRHPAASVALRSGKE